MLNIYLLLTTVKMSFLNLNLSFSFYNFYQNTDKNIYRCYANFCVITTVSYCYKT